MSSTPQRQGAGSDAAPAAARSKDTAAAKLPRSGSGQRASRSEGSKAGERGTRPQRPQRPASGGRPSRSTPRRVRLTLSRIDPWSVMKIAFLLSVAAAIAGVVMVAVMWTVLSGMGVFSALQDMLGQLESGSGGSTFDLMDYIGFGRMVSLSVVIGVIDIVLLTAIATLAAFLYNICASLVGGIQLTLSDE